MNQPVGGVGVYHMELIVECQVRDAISSIRCSSNIFSVQTHSFIHSAIPIHTEH
ncbi:MAG: hypothetical protein ACI8RD_009944 [Bacillariaceae sp.]|jgi:hypothetical protein